MSSQPENQAEVVARRLKAVLFVTVIVPIVALALFLEFRFESIEQDLRLDLPGERDLARVELDALPWHPVQGQTVYVPAYSHIYHQAGNPHLLTVTLSARNTDLEREIVLMSVRYHDSGGKELRSLLKKPLRLGPLASTEFVIEKDDRSGGSGACFLVEWTSGEPVTEPVIETIMIDTSSTQGISFARAGTVLKETLPPPGADIQR